MEPVNVAIGVFFYSRSTDRFLFLMRNDQRNHQTWALPGGKVEVNETLYDGLARECVEEMQYFPKDAKLIPIQKFVNHNFIYHTFFCEVASEFIPVLNSEHVGYCWVNSDTYPKPLHPGLFNSINIDIVQDKLKNLVK